MNFVLGNVHLGYFQLFHTWGSILLQCNLQRDLRSLREGSSCFDIVSCSSIVGQLGQLGPVTSTDPQPEGVSSSTFVGNLQSCNKELFG